MTKERGEVMRLMREHAPAAVAKLLEGLDDPKRVNFSIEMILAYALGKPKQAVEISGEDGGAIGFEVIRRVIVDPSKG